MLDKKINVLFLLPSLRYTGAERQVVDLVNGLPPDRFNLHLFTFSKQLHQLDRLNREKISFHNRPRRFKFDTSIIPAISQIIQKEKIDVLHCTNQIALLFGFLGRLRAGRRVRLIAALHTTVNRNLKNELFDWLLYVPIMMFCDVIITVCRNQRIYWSRKYPWLASKFVTIHNGIDTEKYHDALSPDEKSQLRSRLGISDQDTAAVIIAALRVEKGHEYAFRAVKILKDNGLKCTLLLVGEGERIVKLRYLAQQLCLTENIRWLGYQKDPRPYLSISDLVLLPSYAVETFSLALLEALSMGKPVVTTDIGGASEMVIEGFNGFLVKPKDVRSLAEKLGRLVAEPDLRKELGERARGSVVQKFNLSGMINKTRELLIKTATSEK